MDINACRSKHPKHFALAFMMCFSGYHLVEIDVKIVQIYVKHYRSLASIHDSKNPSLNLVTSTATYSSATTLFRPHWRVLQWLLTFR